MKLETQKQIAQNLRILRTSKCISQAYLAKLIGISRAAYVSYEIGSRTPDAEVLYNISARFGISMNSFFECDQQKFLSILSDCEVYEDALLELISQYKSLSPFAKGMLAERASCLVEWDKTIAANKKALAERRASLS